MTLDKQDNHCLLLDGQDCATSQLLQRVRVETDLLDEHWFVVAGLQPSYQALLDKQTQQLDSQRESAELSL